MTNRKGFNRSRWNKNTESEDSYGSEVKHEVRMKPFGRLPNCKKRAGELGNKYKNGWLGFVSMNTKSSHSGFLYT